MGSNIKYKIAKNVYDIVQNNMNLPRSEELLKHIRLEKSENKIMWKTKLQLKVSSPELDLEHMQKSKSELLESYKTIKSASYRNYDNHLYVDVEVENNKFIKDVLDSNPTNLVYKSVAHKNIFEFSSPNIAKPFHMGHLRSTMIGNCLANINKKLGNDVVRINYLGDWGTQVGMIFIGLEDLNYSDDEFKKDPIKMLYQAYVRGNSEAQKKEEIYEKAKEFFLELETGKEERLKQWNRLRSVTEQELMITYDKLGVTFDEYNWESDYKRKNADELLKRLEAKGLLNVEETGVKSAVVENKKMPLVKSDGTTLYLLRDLMAVVDRQLRHKFNEMYYVVENGQNEHFNSLFTLCKALNIDENVKLEHVKFGRIHGMSTRKGKVVFIKDILEEATERAYQRQVSSKTTKVSLDDKDVATVLGVSGVVINDLRLNRKRDYNFSWEEILRMSGGTGIQLQYCHCRLYSLEKNSGASLPLECDPEAFPEQEAVDIILQIARFEEAVLKSAMEMEPCVLVQYLFDLSKAINVGFKTLKVKDADPHISSQRLLMFKKGQEVFAESLKLLGLKPLNMM